MVLLLLLDVPGLGPSLSIFLFINT